MNMYGNYLSRRVNMSDVTRILNAIEQGDAKVANELLPLVYEELRRLAAQKMSQELPGQTLQATALVNEAYVRLVGQEVQDWNSRTHFFTAAAQAMRRILIDNARRKQRLKHGGGRQKIDLQDIEPAIEVPSDDLIALDEALTRLAQKDKVKADLVKLRYFAGLTLEQAADLLGLSERTAKRYWAHARAWLYREISEGR
jgi:RNA polymerase sigma factor (TIGR02999 family)